MTNPNIETDYEFARTQYYDLIERGQEGIDLMMNLAQETESPRVFEVLSQMIKNTADISDKLMAINKDKHIIDKPVIDSNGVTNNNLFVGSTKDLQELINSKSINHEST